MPAPEKKKIPRWVWVILIFFAAYPLLKIVIIPAVYFMYGFIANVPEY